MSEEEEKDAFQESEKMLIDQKRTVRAFVEDLLSDGRTAEQIIIVAKNTVWNPRLDEVKQVLKSFSKKLKKVFTDYGE